MARFPIPRPPGRLRDLRPLISQATLLMRRGPLREGAFRSRLHDERTTSIIGTALGVAFATAFVTGLISHELQHPASWFPLITRPVWFYRFTQGLHVASGIASIPLLLAKLWTVYPRLYAWPPVQGILHGLERLSIGVLVGGAIFELVTGLLNIIQWYPWKFPFTQTHFWVAWITVGALILHIAVKAPAIARGLSNRPAPDAAATADTASAPAPATPDLPAAPTLTPTPAPLPEPALALDAPPAATPSASPPPPLRPQVSRRAMLTTTGIAVGVVTATTIGASVTSLSGLDLLAPRDPHDGPQDVPINRTARQAGVLATAFDPDWQLNVVGPKPFQLSLAELRELPQYTAQLPIACVEGWSVNATWQGVRIRDLLDRAGAPAKVAIRITSLERYGAYANTLMEHQYTGDPLTLLALRLNGEALSIDHGFPARIIAPARPGVLQTKWVTRIEVM